MVSSAVINNISISICNTENIPSVIITSCIKATIAARPNLIGLYSSGISLNDIAIYKIIANNAIVKDKIAINNVCIYSDEYSEIVQECNVECGLASL